MFSLYPMADEDTKKGDEDFPADAQWNNDYPDESRKLAIFSERKRLAEEHQRDWFWHLELAYEYRESSQVPPELRNVQGDILYWCLNVCRDILANLEGSLTASEPIPVWSGRGFEDDKGGRAIRDVFNFTTNNKKTTNLKVLNGLCTYDMVTCGLGAALEYWDEDMLVHVGPKKVMFGDVCSERLDVRRLLIDPSRRLADVRSPAWCIYTKDVPLRWIKQKFGEKALKIRGKAIKKADSLITPRQNKDYDDNDAQQSDQVTGSGETSFSSWTRVAEIEYHYYTVSEPVEVVYRRVSPPAQPQATLTPVPDPSLPPDQQQTAPPQAESADSESFSGWTPVDYDPDEIPPEERDYHHVVSRIQNRVRKGMVCEGILLKDEELPDFDEIPISFWKGEEIRGFHLPVGLIYHLRHPQDLINSLISTVGENALLTNNPWTIWEETALSPEMKQRIEDSGSAPGLKLETRPGMLDRVKRDTPPQIPTGILTVWQEILQILDRIAGRYDVQFGRPPYDMSGRGLIASQQAADLSSQVWMRGMIGGLEQLGMFRLRNIQKNYVYGRALRITDEFGKASVLHLRQTSQGMSVVTEEGEMLLEDLSTAEFDLEMKVEPNAMEPPETKQKKGQVLFEAGAWTPLRLAEAYGDQHAEKHIEERKKWDEMLALGDAAQKATQQDPEILTIIQNPQIFKGMEERAKLVQTILNEDPGFLPFLQNPVLFKRLINTAIAQRNGGVVVPPEMPPVGAGV